MGTENEDVTHGIANGTQSTFKKVRFKQGKKLHPIQMHGKWVYAIDVDDVEYLQLHCKSDGQSWEWSSRGELGTRMWGLDFPVVISKTPVHWPNGFFVETISHFHHLAGKNNAVLLSVPFQAPSQ